MSRRYPDRPLVGVGALIMRDGKVLLVRRATEPLKGEWSLPGGLVEVGETLQAAVAREVKEETGLTVEVAQVAAVIDRIYPDPAGKVEYHYILIDYLCHGDSADARPGSDVDAVAWCTREQLEALQIQQFTREIIVRHLQ